MSEYNYLHLEIEGRTLARMLDNVMLFNEDCPADWPKAELILMAMDPDGIALWASDRYSVVREGMVARNHVEFELTNNQASEMASVARATGTKTVILDHEDGALSFEGIIKDTKTKKVEKFETTYGVRRVVGDELWPTVVAMLPIGVGSGSPDCAIYGWSLERLQRFGRVKVPTGTPKTADIWYEPADRGAIAHVLVGPTFQGALKSLSRETLLRNNPDVKLWDSPES